MVSYLFGTGSRQVWDIKIPNSQVTQVIVKAPQLINVQEDSSSTESAINLTFYTVVLH